MSVQTMTVSDNHHHGHHGSSRSGRERDRKVSELEAKVQGALERKNQKKKLSRWDPAATKSLIPGVPSYIPGVLSKDSSESLVLRIRIEEITHKLTSGQLDLGDERDRSPSPEPVYDMMGKRVNTREMRARDKIARERQKLIERCFELNPLFKPPPDYRPIQTKKQRKIPVPVDKFPEYNFIGLIIGPRGLTQKELEKKTGAKIAIRGKGSVKDGKARIDGRFNPGEDEELHVLITADTEESLDQAAIEIQKLLVPVEEGKNEHKRQQLRKLAEINGTLRDNNWATAAGGKPTDPLAVQCGFCGEVSHPTSDCPLKGQPGIKSKMDQEVDDFMAELSGTNDAPKSQAEVETQKAYEEFMASLGGGGDAANRPAGAFPPTSAPPPWANQAHPPYPHHQPPNQPGAPWNAHMPQVPWPGYNAGYGQPPPPGQPNQPGAPWNGHMPQVPWPGYNAGYGHQPPPPSGQPSAPGYPRPPTQQPPYH